MKNKSTPRDSTACKIQCDVISVSDLREGIFVFLSSKQGWVVQYVFQDTRRPSFAQPALGAPRGAPRASRAGCANEGSKQLCKNGQLGQLLCISAAKLYASTSGVSGAGPQWLVEELQLVSVLHQFRPGGCGAW